MYFSEYQSSSVSVVSSEKKALATPKAQSQSPSSSRRVCFDESRNTVQQNEHRATPDCWYTKADYKQFESDLSQSIRSFRAKESLASTLKALFEQDDDDRTMEAMEETLIRFYTTAANLEILGLENEVAPAILSNLEVRREMLQDKVSDLQSDEDSDDDEMMQACDRITGPARDFAQALARAQFVAQ